MYYDGARERQTCRGRKKAVGKLLQLSRQEVIVAYTEVLAVDLEHVKKCEPLTRTVHLLHWEKGVIYIGCDNMGTFSYQLLVLSKLCDKVNNWMSFREFLQTRNPKKEKHNIVTLGRKKKFREVYQNCQAVFKTHLRFVTKNLQWNKSMWFCVFHHQSLVFPKLIIPGLYKRGKKGGRVRNICRGRD